MRNLIKSSEHQIGELGSYILDAICAISNQGNNKTH